MRHNLIAFINNLKLPDIKNSKIGKDFEELKSVLISHFRKSQTHKIYPASGVDLSSSIFATPPRRKRALTAAAKFESSEVFSINADIQSSVVEGLDLSEYDGNAYHYLELYFELCYFASKFSSEPLMSYISSTLDSIISIIGEEDSIALKRLQLICYSAEITLKTPEAINEVVKDAYLRLYYELRGLASGAFGDETKHMVYEFASKAFNEELKKWLANKTLTDLDKNCIKTFLIGTALSMEWVLTSQNPSRAQSPVNAPSL